MRTHRFFSPTPCRVGEVVELPGAEVRHARRALRLGPGDRIVLFDGGGLEYEAVLEEPASPEGAEAPLRARILTSRVRTAEPSLSFILLQGLPKGEKMELIVQKTTELGVSRIIPVVAERSVSRPEPGRGAARAMRWQRIAQEAAKQAGRTVVPAVDAPQGFEAALRSLPAGCLLLVPWEGERRRSLAEAVDRLAPGMAVAVVIGPEGGLSEHEIELLEQAGALTATLGPRILRTETAGLTTLACLLFATGNLE